MEELFFEKNTWELTDDMGGREIEVDFDELHAWIVKQEALRVFGNKRPETIEGVERLFNEYDCFSSALDDEDFMNEAWEYFFYKKVAEGQIDLRDYEVEDHYYDDTY